MRLYHVVKARLVYDSFKVRAEDPRQAAQLVSNGKVPEDKQDVAPTHDTMYDDADTIAVLSDQNDGCGNQKTLFTTNEEDL